MIGTGPSPCTRTGFDRFGYGQRDLYLRHTLAPGGTRTFEGWLQIVPRGDLAPVVAPRSSADTSPTVA